jgi:hypothetical protein
MKTLRDFLNLADFLGDEMTEEQAIRFMDEAKQVLSIAEIEVLLNELPGTALYTEVSMYDAEMGGLSRY